MVIRACWALVGVCRLVLTPVPGSGMFVCISTGVNVRYLLVYLAFANVQVGVFGYTSACPLPFLLAECVVASPEKVPNRLSATTRAHRSAAQNGQYSAPM